MADATVKENHHTWRIVSAEGEKISSVKLDIHENYFLPATDQAAASGEPLKPVATEIDSNAALVKPAIAKKLSVPKKSRRVLMLSELNELINYLGYTKQEVAEMFEVDPSTLSRWQQDKPIGKLRSKAMYDIDHIIAKGVRLFGSKTILKEWLSTTNYALGDQKPLDLLKDAYGITMVDNAIEAMSWGNFV